jgi:hypothetical protein
VPVYMAPLAVRPNPFALPAHLLALAIALHTLSVRLTGAGRRDDVLAAIAIEETVGVYRSLGGGQPRRLPAGTAPCRSTTCPLTSPTLHSVDGRSVKECPSARSGGVVGKETVTTRHVASL